MPDIDTEHAVMEAINNIKNDTTVILIAHRLNTVKNCDYIFKLDRELSAKVHPKNF